jgi:hypothetical protein
VLLATLLLLSLSAVDFVATESFDVVSANDNNNAACLSQTHHTRKLNINFAIVQYSLSFDFSLFLSCLFKLWVDHDARVNRAVEICAALLPLCTILSKMFSEHQFAMFYHQTSTQTLSVVVVVLRASLTLLATLDKAKICNT